ncbi:MAG: DUF1566 domain-containing protein [Deltaproteobacteria bacterium]|nr:DUF1566 domain-containing protein [Deltaproteobacteria bacterium]
MTTNRQRLAPIIMATVLLAFALLSTAPARAGNLSATGQTTSYKAAMDYGVSPVPVPDDGTQRRGAPLHYKVLGDGTVEDLNTGLIWEVKCADCGGLHDVAYVYPWSGDGSTDTIWDWLDDINAEGGTGYAGHHDWRIPNVRELQSIVDFGLSNPAISPIFGPTLPVQILVVSPPEYWSSTSNHGESDLFPPEIWAKIVDFRDGAIYQDRKSTHLFVRAVRGGPKYHFTLP